MLVKRDHQLLSRHTAKRKKKYVFAKKADRKKAPTMAEIKGGKGGSKPSVGNNPESDKVEEIKHQLQATQEEIDSLIKQVKVETDQEKKKELGIKIKELKKTLASIS